MGSTQFPNRLQSSLFKTPPAAVPTSMTGIPLPPTYCYLKLDFLPVTMTWFDQERIEFDPERIRA